MKKVVDGKVVSMSASEIKIRRLDVLEHKENNKKIEKLNAINEIKKTLKIIDEKRIRPLAEGDDEYLNELNNQASIHRAEIKKIQTELEG